MGGWMYWLFMFTRDASIEWMILHYIYLYTSADDACLHVDVVYRDIVVWFWRMLLLMLLSCWSDRAGMIRVWKRCYIDDDDDDA